METYLVQPDKSQEKALKAFLTALEVPYEIKKDLNLPAHVISGIERGREDINLGRTITLEQFKTKIGSF